MLRMPTLASVCPTDQGILLLASFICLKEGSDTKLQNA